MPNPPPSPLRLLAGDRQPGETGKAVQACNDWLRLGPGRTLRALLQQWGTGENRAITDSIKTLEDWSGKYGWAARAEAYDSAIEAAKNARRAAVLGAGLALDFERVDQLKRLAATLEAQLYAEGLLATGDPGLVNLWLADVKSIGMGINAERVDIVRFNGPLVEQLRGVYEDLAKETGGRVQKAETKLSGDLTFLGLVQRATQGPPR